jgi:hypothetical protein
VGPGVEGLPAFFSSRKGGDMTSESYLAKKIRGELAAIERGEGRTTRETLVEWLTRYEKTFDPAELAELRLALSVEAIREHDFHSLVPSGWFKEMLEWTNQTESPSSFYFLSAACVIGGLIGRRIAIDRGTYRIFPALSGLILSPAGRGRRSTACDLMIYELGRPAGLSVIADSFTYEAMGEALTEMEKPEALVYVGELSVLLGKGSYGESIIPKLTDLIGKTSNFEWRTVKRGLVEFKEPCLSMLATSAPDWLAANIPAVAFGGGFLSRFLVAAQAGPERTVVWGDGLDGAKKQELIAQLKMMRTRFGKLGKPGKGALEWYTDWYVEHSAKLDKGEVVDEKLLPYLARKHDHLLRLATVLTVAGADEKLEFTVRRLEQALGLLNWYEGKLPLAYSSMALGPIGQAQHAVVRAIERAGGMLDHSTLHKKVYRLAPLAGQFWEVMRSLVEMEVVQESTGMSGRGKTYILKRGLE